MLKGGDHLKPDKKKNEMKLVYYSFEFTATI